jgi:hypothetical protein
VREPAALLGHWQQCVGIGMLLRQAADASGCPAHSCPRVKVGGSSGTHFAWLASRVAQGKNWGGAAALALLVLLGLR